MNTKAGRTIILLFIVTLSFKCFGQNIFSEKDFEYKKAFLPYDVPYIFALEDKHFILLSEQKKNHMKLGRYDQYFFDQWEREVELKEEESAPQVFLKGDSLVLYSITSFYKEKKIHLSFRFFDVNNGDEFKPSYYTVEASDLKENPPQLAFCETRSKFVVFNYMNDEGSSGQLEGHIYSLGQDSPLKTIHYQQDIASGNRTVAGHLSNDGHFCLVSVNPGDFKVETYFWGSNGSEASKVNNNFFFERPVNSIGEINIVRQSPSSYFVSFTAKIGEELIGFNVTGFNVVLKTVMFSHNQNLRKDDINSLYENYHFTTIKQKKKDLEAPEILENFRLVDSYVNLDNDITLIIEELELPVDYFKNAPSQNMDWKHKSKDDKFFDGGDILMYSFSENGQLKWKRAIQKTQYSQANGLGLSFISRVKGNNLKLLLHESSKDGNFYIIELNSLDGTLINKINLMPDRKFEFTKKYSCWLTDDSLIICGIAPANIFKRTLMLVEF